MACNDATGHINDSEPQQALAGAARIGRGWGGVLLWVPPPAVHAVSTTPFGRGVPPLAVAPFVELCSFS